MTRELSNIIHDITLLDAVNIVLPIIMQLGKDQDDSVKEALAGELDKIIYFYYEVNIFINIEFIYIHLIYLFYTFIRIHLH